MKSPISARIARLSIVSIQVIHSDFGKNPRQFAADLFTIALAHFGFGNSRVFGGQTLGKKAVRSRVVDANDEAITAGRSMLRYSILGVPWFINNSRITMEAVATPLILAAAGYREGCAQ